MKNEGGKKLPMEKSKKNKNKPKLNLTVREGQRSKLEQMASLENRSVSNLIEVMADECWERLAEQQGVAYAKTVAEAMKLKLDADKPADREKSRSNDAELISAFEIDRSNRFHISNNAWMLYSSPNSALARSKSIIWMPP
jgi:hypothetical protein